MTKEIRQGEKKYSSDAKKKEITKQIIASVPDN
jgi:hypothetical protein